MKKINLKNKILCIRKYVAYSYLYIICWILEFTLEINRRIPFLRWVLEYYNIPLIGQTTIHSPMEHVKTTQKSKSPNLYPTNTRHCLTVSLRTKYLHNPEVTTSSTPLRAQPTSPYSRQTIFTRPGCNEQAAFNLPIITPSDLLPSFHSFLRIASAGFMAACSM